MKRYRFQAAIQPSTGWGAFVIFPHSVCQEFGVRSRVPVRASFDAVPCAGSLMPHDARYHRLAVPKQICEQLGKAPGDLIDVHLWQDDAPRTVELPKEFVALLKKERLFSTFELLTPTRRKEYRNWIISAKKEETRQRRMEKALKWVRAE